MIRIHLIAAAILLLSPPTLPFFLCKQDVCFSENDKNKAHDLNNLTLSNTDDLRERSLSPWKYENHSDPQMFPSSILIAKCKGSYCTDPGNFTKTNFLLNSVAIKYTIPVYFREKCQSDPGHYCLKTRPLAVTVGCTCARHL
ncbi:interleukin-17F [Acipenser oxyrinchus oxyrinchus]|uniref:Interleukin-17F n=1 Tax=Acipenser oxyrinchus oxyrinchus TaxID=40147 RepID=A0AAD8CLF3_ACIOX|nr:interleukin-17F [Acipenser oxyrinchus oxyrinchus]